MKKLIFRKISKDILIFFMISLILLGIIVWTLQAINYFDLVMEDGHGVNIYFFFSILNFPKIIHRILPFVFFISLFYILIAYEKRNELDIFWLNGVSKKELLNKIIFISIFLLIFQIFNGSYLTPKSQLKARNLLKNSNIDFFSSLIKEQKFINVIKGITIFINKKNNDGTFQDIFLEDSSKATPRMIFAKNGILIFDKDNKILQLNDGKIINKEENKFKILEFSQINLNLSEYDSNTIIKPKIKEIDTLTLIKCLRFKEKFLTKLLFNCEKKIYQEIQLELLKRLFNPIYLILIAIVTSTLITTSKNDYNFKKIRNLTFFFSILIIILSETILRYSVQSEILFIIFLITPFIMIVLTYKFFLRLAQND